MLPFFIFLIAAVFAFLIPGNNLLSPLKRPLLEKIILGGAVGLVLWVVQSYIFGFLGMRSLSYLYLLVNLVIFFYLFRKRFKLAKPAFGGIDRVSVLIMIVGIILNLSAVWFVGVKTADGLFFCCRGVPDTIYHLSLTSELVKSFPPQEPGMAGVGVKNYHYLSNLLSADISRIFRLNFISVQFQYMSLLTAFILGGSVLVLGTILKLNRVIVRWILIFVYGSGDIIYLLLYLRNKGFDFSVTIMDDASKLLAGPPRALSVALLFAGICLLCLFIKKRSLYAGFLAALVMGVLVGFKVYTGIFALSGFAALGLYLLIKKESKMLLVPVFALVIALFYYLPNNKDAGGLYFNGLWRFENFMQHKDLAISKLDYLRIWQQAKGNFLGVAGLEILFVIIYFVTLFGTVNLGFLQSKKSLKLLPLELNIFLISAVLVSLVAGSFFYQNTGGANTIQFLITVFIVGSIYASIALYYQTRSWPKSVKYVIFCLVFALTVARPTFEIANNFLNIASRQGFLIDNAQLASLEYIRTKTPQNAIVAVEPWMAEDEPFMYVTFLANRQFFLSGAGVLRDHGQNTKSRENIDRIIFSSSDENVVLKLLKENNINYVYVPTGRDFAAKNSKDVQKVFQNGKATIYKVQG